MEYEVYRLQEVEENSWDIQQALDEKTDEIKQNAVIRIIQNKLYGIIQRMA